MNPYRVILLAVAAAPTAFAQQTDTPAPLLPETPAEAAPDTPTPDTDPASRPADEPAPTSATAPVPEVPLVLDNATPEEREASATSLLAAGRFEIIRAALTGDHGPGAAAAARAALSRSAGSPSIYQCIAQAAETGTDDGLTAVALLARWNDRDAIRATVRLLRLAADRESPPLAQAAASTLERVTGVPCEAASPEAWLTWWSDAEWLPESDWQAALIAAHRRRWMTMQANDAALSDLVGDLYRRLHAQLSPEHRTALVQEMLTSERRRVRVSGLRLIEGALLNGRAVDPALAAPTASMLADESAEIRQLAARSLLRFAPAAPGTAVVAALAREHDPATAATLLDLAAVGTPTAKTAELAEPWLAHTGAAGDAAAKLLLAALRADTSPGDAFHARLLETLRARLASTPTVPLLRLLAHVGGERDLELVTTLVRAGEGPLAAAAVQSLGVMPGGYGALAAVAEAPDLRPFIADALSRNASGLTAYRFLLRLINVPEPLRHESLARVWAALPSEDLAQAARETPSPALRAALLRERLTTENDTRPEGDTRQTLALLLAEAVAIAGDPSDVFEALALLDRDTQASLGSELAAAALRNLTRRNDPLPPPRLCAPALWTAALARLWDDDPPAAIELANHPGLRAYIDTDATAAAALRELEQRAAVAGTTDEPEDPPQDEAGATDQRTNES